MLLRAFYIVLLVGFAAADLSSVSSIISRLLHQAQSSKNQGPVILVINSKALQESSSSVEARANPKSFEESNELINILSKLTVPRSTAAPKRSRPKNTLNRAEEPRTKTNKDSKIPVYKSLLSLRNSLRCGARSECKDECAELPTVKKEVKCKAKCEKQFQCDEEPQSEEGCNECDEVSTKGPPASEEKPRGCKRC